MHCAGSRTYPKTAQKWSAESEVNGLGCEAERENFSADFTLFFACISNHFISVLLKGIYVRQGGLRCCSQENVCCNAGSVLPALKKSWNRIHSGHRCF